jgi:hypothetical protein
MFVPIEPVLAKQFGFYDKVTPNNDVSAPDG